MYSIFFSFSMCINVPQIDVCLPFENKIILNTYIDTKRPISNEFLMYNFLDILKGKIIFLF